MCVLVSEKNCSSQRESNSEEAARDIPIPRKQPLGVHNGALLSHCRRDNNLSVLSRHTKGTHLEVRVLKLLWDSRGCNRRWEEKVWRYSACVCVFDESLKAECNVFVRRIVYLVISISIIVELVPE